MNTLPNHTETVPEQAAAAAPAPVPPRLLAAFVDFLLVQSFFFLLQGLAGSDTGATLSLLLGACYYIIGNSELTGGKTLGKRIFGLEVRSLRSGDPLSVPRSVLRYLFSFGLLVLLGELPPRFYRGAALIAPAYLLEAHMLLALVYSSANLFTLLLDADHRGLHDRVAGSIVVRCQGEAAPKQGRGRSRLSRLAPLYGTALGALAGSLLWMFGLPASDAGRAVLSVRYRLEHELGAHILAVEEQGAEVVIHAAIPEPGPLPGKELADEMASFLAQQGALPQGTPLTMTIYRKPSGGGEAPAHAVLTTTVP